MDKQRSLAAIRYLILREKSRLKTWRDIAEVFGISCGMAWRIGMAGYEPKDNKIREKLHLPLLIDTPACLKCGQVHVTKRCMANNGNNGHRPRRVAIRTDNPESAARTIEKHFGKAFISELIELLDKRHDYY